MMKIYLIIESYYENLWIPYSAIACSTMEIAKATMTELVTERHLQNPTYPIERYDDDLTVEIGYDRYEIREMSVVQEVTVDNDKCLII